MRLSRIQINIVSKMGTVLIQLLCLWIFDAMALANELHLIRSDVRNREYGTSLLHMFENLTEVPYTKNDVDVLNLAYNQISYLDDRIFLDNNYKHIKKIYIFHNNIRNISVNAFKDLKKLKILDMSNNNITSLDPYTFLGNNKLQTIICMNNEIIFDRLQTFIFSHSVETLILSNNMITEIYGMTFLGAPNLKRLVLSDNKLTALAPISFKSLRKLHYLSLANTGVHKLSSSMFITFPRIINIENTPLSKLFEPPLRTVKSESVTALLKINY